MSTTVTANAPASIQAFQVIRVGPADSKTQQRVIMLSNGTDVVLTQKQHTAFLPAIGDYYVIPSEGHPYCITKNQFLQSYIVG